MLSIQGYRTENGLSSYPFKDTAGRTTAPSGRKLPDGLFIEAQITTKLSGITRAFLQGVSPVGGATEAGKKKLLVQLQLFNPAGAQPHGEEDRLQFELPSTLVAGNTHSYLSPGGSVLVRLVMGPALPAFQAGELGTSFAFDTLLDNPTLGASGAGNVAEFVPSCLIVQPAAVSSIQFHNVTSTVATAALVAEVSGDMELVAGTNLSLIPVAGGFGVDVLPGAGTGLFDACTSGSTGIRTLNKVGGTDAGDFTLHGSDCYSLRSSPAKVIFSHHCEPKCTAAHISAFVHYWNRIRDGLRQLNEYGSTGANSVQVGLLATLASYKAKVESLLQNKAPYIEVQHAQNSAAGRTYLSFAVGVYDPNRQDLLVNFAVTPPVGVTWTYVPNTAFLRENNNAYPLPFVNSPASWKFIDRNLNCRSSVVMEYVVSTASVLADSVFLFHLSQSATVLQPSTAFKMHVVNPKAYHYSVKTKRLWNATTGSYRYNFVIELFNAALDTTAPTVSTGFNLLLFDRLRLVSGSAKIVRNNSTVTGLNDTLNYTGLSINFAQRATISFDADFAATSLADHQTLAFEVTAAITVNAVSFAKTFSLR